MGLWDGILDLDAVQTLASGITEDDVRLVTAAGTRVLPSEQYFPISSMNLAVRGAVACLMYYPPMGLGSPFSRFDDIWCGLVLQRVCRHLRLSIVCGAPLVEHLRASDPFVNLEKEGTGIGANERVWELIDAIELDRPDPAGRDARGRPRPRARRRSRRVRRPLGPRGPGLVRAVRGALT